MQIGNINQFGHQIDCKHELLDDFYEQAILEKNSLERIHCLEDLFCTLDENYRLDYEDFCLHL